MALRKSPTDKVCITHVAVPLSRLAEIIKLTKLDIDNSGLLGSIVGHVGDGNFHTLLMFDESQRAVVDKLVHTMVERAIEINGTATGEHGVGLVKRDYVELELGKTTVDPMKMVTYSNRFYTSNSQMADLGYDSSKQPSIRYV